MPMKRTLAATLLALLAVRAADAQIIRQSVTRSPTAYVALSLGWAQMGGICDAPTNACWGFQGAPQWRGSFELPAGRGAAFGLTGTTSRVEVDYSSGLGGSCVSCTAHANVSQLLGSFRIGGGNEIGFHQLIEVSGGAIIFANFRDPNGTRLGAATTTDPAFSLGYGFGYGMGGNMEFMLLQEYGLVIHQHHTAGSNNTAQQTTTRIGLRFGLGG